ncbi:hypothetical protein PINS_up012681 [Pythium insidiosum]|nr:hypothetical protein PINS_up012681 [Pythium insidiosum]
MASAPVYRHDGKTTYCYYSGVKISSELPARDSKDVLVADSGSRCPVRLTVDVPARFAKATPIAVKYAAVLDDERKNPSFEFPRTIARAPVPEPLRATSNGGANGTTGVSGDQLFDVPRANIVICDYGKCDVFTSAATADGNYFASSNNPQNFESRVVAFDSKEIVLPKEGKYTGFAHIAVNVGGNSRADFVTFFPVQVGEPVGSAPKGGLKADSRTTYCWTARNVSPFEAQIKDSQITVRTDANCPASMKAVVSKKSVVINEEVTVDWSMQLESATRDPMTLLAEVSSNDAVVDPATGVYSVVPVSVLSACEQSGDNAKCSSYSGDDSKTFDIQTFKNYNLTGGVVSYSVKHKFSEPGSYLLISRVAMQTTDGDRIDMAVYSTLDVTIPKTVDGMLFVYIGVGIGALILLLGLLYCYMRKRRARRRMKEIPFRTPMPPPMVPDRSSQFTATSSAFMQNRTPEMRPYGAGTTFPHAYPSDDVPFYAPRNVPNDSFSLDPYSRNSFNDMDDHHDGMDETIRPTDISKFSFQTGYDDDSDWEYDTQKLRADGRFREFGGDTHRGTYDMHHEDGAMPIMEESDRHTGGPSRSTNSSGWTART